jgi:outer membrane protein, heavy metal efflux system
MMMPADRVCLTRFKASIFPGRYYRYALPGVQGRRVSIEAQMFRTLRKLVAAAFVIAVSGAARADPPQLLITAPMAPSPTAAQGEQTPAESIPTPHETSSPQLTLADFEGIALVNNPTLAGRAAMIRAAQGRALQAGLYPNPSVGYMGSEVGNEGTAAMQGGYIEQEFVTGGKLRISRAVVEQEVRQARQELSMQQLKVLNDVRTQFYDVLVAQRLLEISQQLVGVGEEGLRVAAALLKAQEVGRADELQARIELDTARIQVENARNRHLGAWRRLAAVAGVPEFGPTFLVDDLESGLRELSWDDVRAQLLTESPELGVAHAQVQRARWNLERAAAGVIPNVTIQAAPQYDFSTGYTIANVQAGLPLPVWNRNQGGIREARAELAAAQLEVARVELNLQERLAAAFEQYANARQQVDKYAQSILPNARANLDLTSGGYRNGEMSYLSLLIAQRTYFQKNIDYVTSLSELRRSTVTIEGLLLGGSLQK